MRKRKKRGGVGSRCPNVCLPKHRLHALRPCFKDMVKHRSFVESREGKNKVTVQLLLLRYCFKVSKSPSLEVLPTMPPLLLVLLQISSSCLWLGRGEVVTSFESSCPQFFFRETPPNDALEPEDPAWICQRYKNQYYFATLYDRSRRIPVYSAYLYQPGPGTRPKTWLVEPQLMGLSYPKTMEKEWTLLNYFNVTLEQLGKSQAVLQDYKNLTGLNRGHLNPSGHHPDSVSRTATFSLTNIVPQDEKLNGGAWNNYEQQTMMRRTQDCNATYVVVGAVPGNNYIAKGRVNKPSHIWSSACCEVDNNHRKSWAVIAENDKNEVHLLTLGELEEVLTELYGREQVFLFDSDCPRE